jgi:hypothetical protein
MECVTTKTFSIYFNNSPLEPFKPTCGLRQGDTQSPYPFLFVADGLAKLMHREIAQGSIRELHICQRAPRISHRLFTDDTLLFLEASEV